VNEEERPLLVRRLGRAEYAAVLANMKSFTEARDASTPDELWLLEHEPVFTLGQAGKVEHLLDPGNIPVVQSDRGGQVTYHAPGQLVVYLLFDIRRLGIHVRDLVTGMESAVIDVLHDYGVASNARREAPGVYVDGKKIAALGLRIRRGFSYHGLSFNIDMDLAPFARINPCGYEGLEVTRLADLGIHEDLSQVSSRLVNHLVSRFGYDCPIWQETHATG
jgi:lipoyl(octanoyl) transferase